MNAAEASLVRDVALCTSAPKVRLAGMTDTDRLREMIDELRRMREQCEPKSNQNRRYLRYSNAVSALRWIINDLTAEHDAP